MLKQICDRRKTRTLGPSLTERIAQLRRRRTALTVLMDSLTAYAHYASLDTNLTYACHLHDPSSQLAARCAPGKLG